MIYVRQARDEDLEGIFNLAKQFTLLNLPADKGTIKEIIELSRQSFAQEIKKEDCSYLFVAEDSENKKVVATSKIVAKHGIPKDPHVYYQIEKRERFSKDLGIGFIHQILKFKEEANGPTEIGGLLVDINYRSRPEKIGKLISFSRFLFIAAFPHLFEEDLHCELAPPLTDEGRSEFWEALGRRFTGLPYEEADRLSHINKEFITSLFPENEIYTTLLETRARVLIGEVGEETKPARALLEKIGFKYKEQIDPFDGGPHYGAKLKDIKVIKDFKKLKLKYKKDISSQLSPLLVGTFKEFNFKAQIVCPEVDGEFIYLNENLKLDSLFQEGEELFTIPLI